jgi:hypothetical protein
LRSPERGWRAQGRNGCSAAVSEKVRAVPFRFRRSKHELFVIAPKADSALGLEALDDLNPHSPDDATISSVFSAIQLT